MGTVGSPIDVPHRRDACAGAVAAYALKRVAFRAGALAPGIQDGKFHDLTTTLFGASLAGVLRWLGEESAALASLGYRFGHRTTSGDSAALASWVYAGRGYRAAICPTLQPLLYPGQLATVGLEHAVGLVVEPSVGADGSARTGDVVMIDPWPEAGRADRAEPLATLDAARREHRQAALVVYWTGWG
jgi:hypothetical protein